ncbi:phosphosulfolactate synthase [Cohnella faecalis]|uniref:Phosphosulfolactate synthase n=1 Tax=Cohnella faecalis TaxID=2315694 RepID=A0A398CHX4_9BACL|nr:phosphosulfolactate synthase [Cohnella faecalis]RIE00739.1 phosphosulfolactate synthase [Cohnella faecalis]
MEISALTKWPKALADPSGSRASKPRSAGLTMVIDKGLGLHSFAELLETADEYIDIVKFGFGTSPLYKTPVLRSKIELAKRHGITVIPGGTLLEIAVSKDVVPAFFRQILTLGFDGIEVSDGTITLGRKDRDELIRDGSALGLRVFTEYGKKLFGSRIDAEQFAETAERDLAAGAELVTVEARESGVGVGLFDERGMCRQQDLESMLRLIPFPSRIMWEAPQKEQQVALIKALGSDVNLGNILVNDVMALETMRRGLRSDTFDHRLAYSDYMI